MRPLFLALHLILAQNTGVATRAAPADATVRARVDSAIRAFQTEWWVAWQSSQGETVTRMEPLDADLRLAALHCHWLRTASNPAAYLNSYIARRIITTNDMPAHAVCLLWFAGDPKTIGDERRNQDFSLPRPRRQRIWPLRGKLRVLLDSAALRLPGDLHLTRQRMRFAIDAGVLRDAWAIASACTNDAVQ